MRSVRRCCSARRGSLSSPIARNVSTSSRIGVGSSRQDRLEISPCAGPWKPRRRKNSSIESRSRDTSHRSAVVSISIESWPPSNVIMSSGRPAAAVILVSCPNSGPHRSATFVCGRDMRRKRARASTKRARAPFPSVSTPGAVFARHHGSLSSYTRRSHRGVTTNSPGVFAKITGYRRREFCDCTPGRTAPK